MTFADRLEEFLEKVQDADWKVEDQLALAILLSKNADAILELVRAADMVSRTLTGGICMCEICGNGIETTDFDYADDLRNALAKLNKEQT